jgi:hypothetical protein
MEIKHIRRRRPTERPTAFLLLVEMVIGDIENWSLAKKKNGFMVSKTGRCSLTIGKKI